MSLTVLTCSCGVRPRACGPGGAAGAVHDVPGGRAGGLPGRGARRDGARACGGAWPREPVLPVTILGGGSNVLVSDAGVRGVVVRVRGGATVREGELGRPGRRRRHPERPGALDDRPRPRRARGVGGDARDGRRRGLRQRALRRAVDRRTRRVGPPRRRRAASSRTCRRPRWGSPTTPAGCSGRARSSCRRCSRWRRPPIPRRCARPRGGRWRTASARSRCDLPSAGCIFQNPDPGGRPRARRDSRVGRRADRPRRAEGRAIGGAGVSPAHANFIVNDGGATAADIRALIDRCRDEVRARFGVALREEIGTWDGIRQITSGRSSTGTRGPCSSHDRQDRTIARFMREVPMSTLLIEGGRALSGRVAVGGNKNAALPLIAACLLTEDECVLTNVPRISDVEVMARLLADLGARGRRHRHQHAAHPLPRRSSATSRRAGWSGGFAARCCCSARCSRAAARARLAPPGRRLPGPPHDRDAPGRAEGDGRARAGGRGARARGAGRPDGRVDVPRGGVGHRHRDGAARRRRRARRHRDPPRRLRAARRRAVPVPAEDGRRRDRRGHPHDSRRRGAAPERRHARPERRLHRGGQLGGRRGGDRRRDRRRGRRARPTWRWWRRCCSACRCAATLDDARLRVEPSTPVGGAAIATGLWPGVPERPHQPRHGARHPGRRAARSCTTGCTSCACSRSSS